MSSAVPSTFQEIDLFVQHERSKHYSDSEDEFWRLKLAGNLPFRHQDETMRLLREESEYVYTEKDETSRFRTFESRYDCALAQSWIGQRHWLPITSDRHLESAENDIKLLDDLISFLPHPDRTKELIRRCDDLRSLYHCYMRAGKVSVQLAKRTKPSFSITLLFEMRDCERRGRETLLKEEVARSEESLYFEILDWASSFNHIYGVEGSRDRLEHIRDGGRMNNFLPALVIPPSFRFIRLLVERGLRWDMGVQVMVIRTKSGENTLTKEEKERACRRESIRKRDDILRGMIKPKNWTYEDDEKLGDWTDWMSFQLGVDATEPEMRLVEEITEL